VHKHEILAQFELFQRASAGFQQELLQSGVHQHVPAGTLFLRDGDSVDRFTLVGVGRVRVFKVGSSGREITLYQVGPGESCILSIASIFGGSVYPATARAEDAVDAVSYPGESLLRWVSTLTEMMTLLEEITFHKVDRRLAEFLLAQFSAERTTRDVLDVTHEQIAGELGTAREVVSRLLKEFERQGVLSLGRSRVELIDGEKLVAFLGSGD
jgi:CRP/FNR family transcriptional regulator